jgi:hypothetical protein
VDFTSCAAARRGGGAAAAVVAACISGSRGAQARATRMTAGAILLTPHNLRRQGIDSISRM